MKEFLLTWLFVIGLFAVFGSVFFGVPLLLEFLHFPNWTIWLWLFFVATGLFTFMAIKED